MSKYNYNRIKEFLAKRGRSNIELAEHIGVTEQSVSAWCTNAKQPTVDKLFRIAEFLEAEAGELLTVKKELKVLKGKR
ncbi:MAG TPA: helix-turn-helix transcriptional regulator [Puia sp.]|jgi:transcriptional regulator with XRE-family HTH domain|nr:helix-turn-helix transcriptional regulator [Puia sp.]